MSFEPDNSSMPVHPDPSSDKQVLRSSQAPPRVWPSILSPLVAIVAAIILQAAFGAVLAVALMVGQELDPTTLAEKVVDAISDPPVFILTLMLGQLAFAVTALACGFLSPEPMRQRLAFPPSYASPKIYLLTCLGSIFVLALSLLAAVGVSYLSNPDESLGILFEKMTIGWSIPFVILIALLPGFIEEILFRGYIQTRFLKRWSPACAIAMSSLLFALAHIAPPAIALALIMGIWFGYIAYRTGSIGPGIACHAFVNGGLNLWRMVVKFAEIPEATQQICNWGFIGVGLVFFVLAVRELRKLSPPTSATDEF